MKKTLIFIPLITLLISISLASSIDFSCPEEVNQNEEFSCTLNLNELEGIWDVKIELLQGSKSIARIYSPEKEEFVSSFYYLNNFIENEEKQIKLFIEESGSFTGTLKLRQDTKKESLVFDIIVNQIEEIPKEDKSIVNEEVRTSSKKTSSKEEIPKEEFYELQEEPLALNSEEQETVILLNEEPKKEQKTTGKVIYESNGYKSLKYSPYVFCVFLIFIIAILLKEKI